MERFLTRKDGARVKAGRWPIAVKMTNKRQKEKLIKKARGIKHASVKFLEGFSQITLDERFSLIPELVEARRAEKISYCIADRLAMNDNPSDIYEEDEVTINHGTATRVYRLSELRTC